MTSDNTNPNNNMIKSDLQKIKDVLSEIEKTANDNHSIIDREPLFQQLVILLKKNSQIILQFVSEKLSLFLKLLEHQIQFGEL